MDCRYLVEPQEIGAIDDLWDDVRDFINSGRLNDTMVAYQQWRNLSGSANESMNMREAADPSDHVYATRLESYYTIFSSIFYHTSDKLTSRNAKEKVQELIETVNREIRNMALAIRIHNSDSALDKIHVIDVLEDLIARKRGLPKYRSAAQNHLETFLGSMSVMVQYLDNCKHGRWLSILDWGFLVRRLFQASLTYLPERLVEAYAASFGVFI